MNGISADPKQGFAADVLDFAGSGETPTRPGKSGGKNRSKRSKKTKERPRVSIISSNSCGSAEKIQDGGTYIANSSAPDPVPVQMGNVPNPTVLSIPDTAADNETISRLLGGQGAALLELGSSDCVNIDFIQENGSYSVETGMEVVQTHTLPASADDAQNGAHTDAQPEPLGSVLQVTASASGSCGGDAASLTSPNLLTKVSSSALDLSMKHKKTSNASLPEILGRPNLVQKTENTNLKLKNTCESLSDSVRTQTVKLQTSLSNKKSIESMPVADIDRLSNVVEHHQVDAHHAQFTDPTGDSLLLDIAQVSAISDESEQPDPHTGDGDASSTQSNTAQVQPPNPLMYIITSRDKSTGLTQRFRVTVDPESVMYIPVMNVDETASSNPAQRDEVSLEFMPDGAKEIAEDAGQVRTSLDSSVRDAILGDGSATASISAGGKEDLGAITGDMITSALMLQGGQEEEMTNTQIQKDDKPVKGSLKKKPADVTWTKKTPQRKKEAQEVFVCEYPDCGQTIVGKSKFRVHKLGHNENRPHKCPHEGCDWSFPSPYKLRRHLAGHSGAKPFVCGMENCGKQFSTIYNLKMHLNSHFRQSAEICEYEGCGKAFTSGLLLKIHQRKHFEEQRLKCEYPGCTKTFTTSSALGSHQRVHVKDAVDYPCPFEGCSKVYDKACRLKLHMRSHTGERPFKCTFEGCDWAFTCIQKLTRHIVRHTGERKYRCKFEGCNKLFTRLEHLKSHEVFHSGQKPFACKEEGCNARFAARSSLYMHQKRHQQAKPMREKLLFSCPLDGCDMSFASKLGLKSHIVKGHGVPLPFTGGAGDFELIGLGNDQLHGSTPSHTSAAVVSAGPSEPLMTTVTLPTTVNLPTIPTSLITPSLLQNTLVPQASASSRDEAASILASSLLTNQLFIPKSNSSTVATSTTTTTKSTTSEHTADHSTLATNNTSLLSTLSVVSGSSGGTGMATPMLIGPSGGIALPSALTVPTSTITLPSSSLPSSSVTSQSVVVPPVTVPAMPKVFHENRSGSARTDFRAVTAKHPLPPDAVQHFKKSVVDDLDVESLSQSDSSQSSDGPHHATFIPLNMMTSAQLTLRDPATGTRYIQTQLLQDDPPDMPDMGFALSSHDSGDQSPLDAALSVSAMLVEAGVGNTSDIDFITSDGVITADMVSSFRESTINLQDLE